MASRSRWEVPSFRKQTDVQFDLDGLRLLALQGCWREITDKFHGLRIQDLPPEDRLAYSAYSILAMLKTRQYSAAALALEALGGLEDSDGSVPFGLRRVAAELPFCLGDARAGFDALYRLSRRCRREAEHVGSGEDAARALWWRRFEAVGLALANRHLCAREHIAALQWLRVLEGRRPGDPRLLSMVGYVQLLIGDLPAAEETFAAAAEKEGGKAHARRNHGLLLFAKRRFPEAQEEFESMARSSPGDRVAINNRAVCQMYVCELGAGIRELEDALNSRPFEHLCEPVAANLALLYELSLSGAAGEAKRQLSNWALSFAPSDFNPTCMRNA